MQKCSIPLNCGIKICGSYAVIPQIPDKKMMEWGMLDATIICLLDINFLNTKLNPICHLLALLGSHHILHVTRIRVKAYKHMKEDFTLKKSASDLIQCRKFELAMRLLKR